MTKKELIEILALYPDDLPIVFCGYCEGFEDITNVYLHHHVPKLDDDSKVETAIVLE